MLAALHAAFCITTFNVGRSTLLCKKLFCSDCSSVLCQSLCFLRLCPMHPGGPQCAGCKLLSGGDPRRQRWAAGRDGWRCAAQCSILIAVLAWLYVARACSGLPRQASSAQNPSNAGYLIDQFVNCSNYSILCRLPDRPVPQARVQPPHRRLRRQHREALPVSGRTAAPGQAAIGRGAAYARRHVQ